MASRKEEKDRLRAAREAAEAVDRKQEQKRLILGYVVAGVITVAVLVGIVFAIASGGEDSQGTVEAGENERVNQDFGSVPQGITVDDRDSTEAPTNGETGLEAAAAAANCELVLEQKDEGNQHIAGKDVPDYDAVPPTSGDHSPDPLADGAFVETPSPLNSIHALEHGRIEIQYSTDLSEEEQMELLGVYDEDRAGMIIFPNDDMPYAVAAVAWRQTLGCDSYEGAATLDAIRAFKGAYRARGPEPIPLG
jgi:hypothetical protein